MTPRETEDRAMARFNVLNITRIAAIVFVVLGAVLISGNFFPDAPPTLGYTVFVIGVIDFFLMPIILRKIWAQKDAGTPGAGKGSDTISGKGWDKPDRTGDDLIP